MFVSSVRAVAAGALGALLFLPVVSVAQQKTLADYRKIYEEHRSLIAMESVVARKQAFDNYGAALKAVERQLQVAGKLEPLIACREEMARFAKEGSVPSNGIAIHPWLQQVQTTLVEATAKAESDEVTKLDDLTQKYLRVIAALKVQLVRDNRIEDAVKVAEEAKRVEFIAADLAAKLPPPPAPALVKSKSVSAVNPATMPALAGAWTDLLELVDLDKHVVQGKWEKKDKGYFPLEPWAQRMALPVRPEGGYEVEASITPDEGGYACFVLPVGPTVATVNLLLGRKAVSLELVDGQTWPGKSGQALPKKSRRELKKEETIDVKLRVQTGGTEATITVEFDGTGVLEWNGQQKSLSANKWPPVLRCLGIGASQSKTVFNSVRMRSLSGSVTRLKDREIADASRPTK